jgi:hypothetical protein
MLQAAIALANHDGAAALALLNSATPFETGAGPWLPYLRGLASMTTGDPAQAARQFRAIEAHPGNQPTSFMHTLERLQTARAEGAAGNAAQARQAHAEFAGVMRSACRATRCWPWPRAKRPALPAARRRSRDDGADHVLLVSMPFAAVLASLGLSLLQPQVLARGLSCRCEYFTLTFGERIGEARLEDHQPEPTMARASCGEWIFARLYDQTRRTTSANRGNDALLRRRPGWTQPDPPAGRGDLRGSSPRATTRRLHRALRRSRSRRAGHRRPLRAVSAPRVLALVWRVLRAARCVHQMGGANREATWA